MNGKTTGGNDPPLGITAKTGRALIGELLQVPVGWGEMSQPFRSLQPTAICV